MELELNLETIQKLAAERENENWEFRAFLKWQSSKKHDALVHRLYKRISEEIDCTTCGNCCREMSPTLKRADVRRLAEGVGVSTEEIEKHCLESEEERGAFIMKEKPCPFLKEDSCTVYPHRPKDCRSYPHLHKKDFASRLLGVIDNYSICPIVFNVYEHLKEELQEEYEQSECEGALGYFEEDFD